MHDLLNVECHNPDQFHRGGGGGVNPPLNVMYKVFPLWILGFGGYEFQSAASPVCTERSSSYQWTAFGRGDYPFGTTHSAFYWEYWCDDPGKESYLQFKKIPMICSSSLFTGRVWQHRAVSLCPGWMAGLCPAFSVWRISTALDENNRYGT